ncbi:MAG: DCC1-like thiol-disulfide oxidoreductase family protein [Candidatus Acidiferrales bacterium]
MALTFAPRDNTVRGSGFVRQSGTLHENWCGPPRAMNQPSTILQSKTGSSPVGAERIFYDGYCGLCQGYVRFLIARDKTGGKFRFAALQGATFEALVPAERRSGLPDSMVVLTSDGRLLIRSDGVIHILRRLGGIWKLIAGIIQVIPRGLRDAVYNGVARIRYRIFGRRDNVCPVTPPELRARFDD